MISPKGIRTVASCRCVPRPPTTLKHLLAEEPFVRSLARSLVADEADDVVQQLWLRALEQQPLTAIQQPRKWLGRIVRNLVADMRRRLGRERRAQNRDRVPSSTQLLEGEEPRRALIKAVDNLPPAQRTVMLMRYYDGLTPRRIAAELGLPVHKVWNRLHDGLATLRSRLDEQTAGDRRAWMLPLVPFATWPRSLPFRETLLCTPILG